VCPECDHHLLIGARERIAQLLDAHTFEEWDVRLEPRDFLSFRGPQPYADKLLAAQAATGLPDAIVTGSGTLDGHGIAIGAFDFRFMGGSMGSVVGEKIFRLFTRAKAERRAVLLITASGGARMQEGVFSLMQMAKTVAGVAALRRGQLPYLALLTHPTTGGVAASMAMLADVIMAEPRALIGFAGPRVIEQTIRAPVPKDAQTAEALYDHGFIDFVIHRRDVRARVAALLPALVFGVARDRRSRREETNVCEV
jgi:acetyl-CoA carboxylase carboxyl transferase subunit beta